MNPFYAAAIVTFAASLAAIGLGILTRIGWDALMRRIKKS